MNFQLNIQNAMQGMMHGMCRDQCDLLYTMCLYYIITIARRLFFSDTKAIVLVGVQVLMNLNFCFSSFTEASNDMMVCV